MTTNTTNDRMNEEMRRALGYGARPQQPDPAQAGAQEGVTPKPSTAVNRDAGAGGGDATEGGGGSWGGNPPDPLRAAYDGMQGRRD